MMGIVAMSRNGVIGNDGAIPWHIPAELNWFKTVTKGSDVIMGRKTFESIGKVLPDRRTIVVTTQEDYIPPFEIPSGLSVNIADSKESVLACLKDELPFVAGGLEIYKMFWEEIGSFWVSVIKEEYQGDTVFPVEDLIRDFVPLQQANTDAKRFSTFGLTRRTIAEMVNLDLTRFSSAGDSFRSEVVHEPRNFQEGD